MDQNTQSSLDNDAAKQGKYKNFSKIEDVLTYYSDSILRKIFKEEYIPWTKTGILEDGGLRNLDDEYRKVHGDLTLVIIEKAFLMECAKRFVNLK